MSNRGGECRRNAVVAATIGNWLELFDFIIFATFAVYIGRAFFPTYSETGQILLAFATFGLGFVMRPLGALLIGAYADRAGRKAALTLTIALMATGTGLLGLTPSYAAIGVAAPLLVVLARLLQGISAGGEIGAATSYLVESAPHGRRGFYGAWQFVTQGAAALAAGLFGFGVTSLLPVEEVERWGWRVPFLFGLLIGPIGFYIRRHMAETAARQARHESTAGLLRTLFRRHSGLILIGVLSGISGTVGIYVIGSYMPTYAIHTLKLPASIGMLATLISGAMLGAGALLGGWLSDFYGRRRVMMLPRALFTLLAVPAFIAIAESRAALVVFIMIGLLSLFQAISVSVHLLAVVECFPRSLRSSGTAITYALFVTIFGGTAQLVVTWLLDATGDPTAVAWYLAATSLISLCAMFFLRPPPASDRLD